MSSPSQAVIQEVSPGTIQVITGGPIGPAGAVGPTGPTGPLLNATNTVPPGNGVDDTAIIQNAINKLTSGSILNFYFGSTYRINANGITLNGGSQIILNLNSSTILPVANCVNYSSFETNFAAFFRLYNCVNCQIQNGFFNASGFGGAFIGLDKCTSTRVTNNQSTNVSTITNFWALGGFRNLWENNYAYNYAAGINNVHGYYIGGSNTGEYETNTVLRNNRAYNLSATCFVTQALGVLLIANQADTTVNAGAGFIVSSSYASTGQDVVVTGNVAINCAFHGFQHDDYYAPPTRITLTGNRFDGNAGYGALLAGGTNTTVVGNVLTGNVGGSFNINATNYPTSNILLSDNICDTARIVSQGAAISNITVRGNSFNNSSASSDCLLVSPVGATDSITNLLIEGNVFYGGYRSIFINPQTNGGSLKYVNILGNSCANAASHGIDITVNGSTGTSSINITNNFSYGLAVNGGTANSIPNVKIIGNNLGTYNSSAINTNNSGATGWVSQYNSFD